MNPPDAIERPVSMVPQSPSPGATTLQEYIEPPEGLSPEAFRTLAHDYIHTGKRVDDLAVELGVSTRDIRTAIRKYGLDKRKSEVISQIQHEELAAYSKFLLDNRVSTAEQHLRISNQLNGAVENLLQATHGKTPEQLSESIKDLKAIASLYRSLGETFAAASGVGARAVSLSGLTSDQSTGFALAATAGKSPLVSMSFNVQAPTVAPRQETMEAEVIDVTPEKETT
jgi:hypothetical protein